LPDEYMVFNAGDFPGLKLNDLVKIYQCDGNPSNFLLIQVVVLLF